MSQEHDEKKLKPKQKLFADYYLTEAHFNGTEAARLSDYKGNNATLAAVAYENLRKPHIKKYIDERLSALTMSANAVLARLTEIAEGKVDDLLDEDGKFNLQTARKNRKTHLIKKLKRKTTSKKVDAVTEENPEDETETTLETSVIHEEIEFEMYSAHEALRDLGKYHKLFTDKFEQSGEVKTVAMTVDEWRKEQAERRRQAAETSEIFTDK